MLTTREAARAIAEGSLGALTTLLGFPRPLALSRRDRLAVDPTGDVARACTAAGRGPLRALTLECRAEGPPLRECAPAIARAVARRSPDCRWLVLARHHGSAELLIAAPHPDGTGPIPSLLVDTTQVRESDAETLATLVAASDGDGILVHVRWRETLGRDALTRRFYRDLEGCVTTLATTAGGRARDGDRRTLALLTTSRLLFLAFLEAKGWLDGDRAFLRHGLERYAGGRGLQQRFLAPLCFGTLNTPLRSRAPAARAFGRVPFLNGGLFARAGIEKRCRSLRFADDALAAIIGDLLARYRLTGRETTTDLSDAAVDPEMLGRAFESLMGGERRRAQGAFYTPGPLTTRITANAIAELRAGTADRGRVRVLDPACGSGAFLVVALELLTAQRVADGDPAPLAAIRRDVLSRCIHGVDRDPVAVWLCQLRLWLSVVVEEQVADPMRLVPLPNLDRNVREGDALAGDAFDGPLIAREPGLEALRLRYVRASGPRKRNLARALDRAERTRAIAAAERRLAQLRAERREVLIASRSPDLFRARRGTDAATRGALARLRADSRTVRAEIVRLRDGGALAFSFATHFAEAAGDGGFDLVLGNPPWVRPHAIAGPARDELRRRFEIGSGTAWEAGAAAAAAGPGFGAQADLAAYFTERAVRITRPGGIAALLLPSKLWCALAGGGLRSFLVRRTRIVALDDWSAGAAGFDAAVYPTALIAVVVPPDGTADPGPAIRLTRHKGDHHHEVAIAPGRLALDATPGAPWLLLSPSARAAFDALTAAGVALASSAFGRPLLGVKTGCNEAFIVRDPSVDLELLRPLLRGEYLAPFRIPDDARLDRIIWTHDPRGEAVADLPDGERRWLSRWRRTLERRADGRGARWWSLFRTEAARSDRPRVVWGDIGKAPRAIVLAAGDPTVPLNTCYAVRAPSEDDAHALAALLNSRVAAAWLAALAEPARGGYRRFLGWTCARLPVPRDWHAARRLLAPFARSAAAGEPWDASALDAAVTRAFDLPACTLEPLLEWRAH